MKPIRVIVFLSLFFFSMTASALVEISGSPFSTDGAPIAAKIQAPGEKLIVINPRAHVYGAYLANGKLLRWGIASAGRDVCHDTGQHCRTGTGSFRIYSLGNANCFSRKYNDASMPYCMYFNGGEALHGSDDVEFANVSHGCVRVHVDDAKWLRYHFVVGPTAANHYLGTKILIKPY